MSVKIDVGRDPDGNPIKAVVKEGNAVRLTVFSNSEGDLSIEGARRYLTPEYLDLLKLVFPFQKPARLEIPQPLQTVQVQGGKTLMFDDFEGLLKWDATSAALDNTVAYNGSQSLKITCGAAGTNVSTLRGFPPNPKIVCGLACYFAFEDISDVNFWTMAIQHIDGTRTLSAEIRFDYDNLRFQYADAGGTFRTLTTIPVELQQQTTYNSWHYFKLVADLLNRKYISLQIDHRKTFFDYPIYVTPFASREYSRIYVNLDNQAGLECNMWLDDVLVTEE